MTNKSKEDQYKEAEDKFEVMVKRMLETPPKPHDSKKLDMKPNQDSNPTNKSGSRRQSHKG